MSSPSPWRSRTATSSPRRSANCSRRPAPKKAKKYSYTKDYKEQPREMCDQCEKKSIQPICDMQRLVCKYEPEESCREEAKQYCHKVEKMVVEEVCDMKFDTQYL